MRLDNKNVGRALRDANVATVNAKQRKRETTKDESCDASMRQRKATIAARCVQA